MPTLASALAHQRRFQMVLIKPSHYDDDGYVIQWMRSGIPSNSLASLYALAFDAAQRQVLGPETAIDITAIDETNTRVCIKDIIALIRRHDGMGMVGACRRAVEPVPTRPRYGAAVPPSRRLGGDQRFLRFRLHRHVAGDAGRFARRA